MARALLCVAACASAFALSLSAQQKPAPATEKPPQFRSGVELVHLDVSVLDRDRRPVRGLTAKDFTILEDGNPRPIAAFAAIDVPDVAKAPGATAPWMSTFAPDVQVNESVRSPEGRLFALVIDDALIPADAAMVATTRKIAETAIDRLSPGDQMAVVFSAGSKGAQNFTSDRSKLRKAVETFRAGSAVHLLGWDMATQNPETDVWERHVDTDAGLRTGSLRTLEGVATSLIAAPQRRKAIIWVSPGIYADSNSASEVQLIGDGRSIAIHDANSSLVRSLPAVFRRLQQANVTIYPLDPAGFGGMEAYVMQRAASTVALSSADPAPPLPSGRKAMELARDVARVELDFLKIAASNTGGIAITDTNDLAGGVNRIFDENASYYLLGFSLTSEHRPGSMHRLQVKLNRPDLTVRTRTGYEVPERPVDTPDKPVPSAAVVALAGPVAGGTLPLRVVLAPFADPSSSEKKLSSVAFTLGLEHPVKETSEQTFDVEVRAFSNDGSGKLGERRTGKVTLRRTFTGEAAVDVLGRIALAPGRYELRFGASLAPLGLAGGLFADVEVPDYSKEALSLSGVLLDITPPGNAGPLDALTGLAPVVPTSRRIFTSSDRKVGTFMRVYQGGNNPVQPVWMRVSIRDQSDKPVYNYPYRLPVAKFTDRAADFVFDIPMDALKRGEYVLIFDATMEKHTASRQVRFSVR